VVNIFNQLTFSIRDEPWKYEWFSSNQLQVFRSKHCDFPEKKILPQDYINSYMIFQLVCLPHIFNICQSHNYMNQFCKINHCIFIYVYTHTHTFYWFCLSVESWLVHISPFAVFCLRLPNDTEAMFRSLTFTGQGNSWCYQNNDAQ
jgi:hypothetical protein